MSKVSKFKAEDFLNPDNFRTVMDVPNKYMEDQYQKAIETAGMSTEISISVNDTWNANGKGGSYTTSYEKLGYHAHTAALLRGFLDSHVDIHVYRWPESEIERNGGGLDHFVITWDGTKHVLTEYTDRAF